MIFARDGHKYELISGSDVDRDTIYLELVDVTTRPARVVLFGEKTENGELRFLSLVNKAGSDPEPLFLPLGLVEEFTGLMREHLNR